MALVVTINGTNRTSILERRSLIVEQRGGSFIPICSLTLLDTAANILINIEDAITIVDGATTFFSGEVVRANYSPFGKTSRHIKLQCRGENAVLEETVVSTVHTFIAEADSDIVKFLFQEYLPAIDRVTYVDTIIDPISMQVKPCSLRFAMSRICEITNGYFYIEDDKLHYFNAENNGVGWYLSDTPDQVNSFSYFSGVTRSIDATTRIDGVYVVGPLQAGWSGTHAAEDKCVVVIDPDGTTGNFIDQRGSAILDKYGEPVTIFDVTTSKAGLRAGMDLRFVCGLYNEDDTFTVRKIIVKWDEAWDAYYKLELVKQGGSPAEPALQSAENWYDHHVGNQRPITTARLPLSVQGWSNNLVFSATDHNTVAWAAAGTIVLANGLTYTINAGNTGNMAATTYIYLDTDTSETVLQTTTTASTAVGANKILVAVAANVAVDKDATFQVFGGEGSGVFITADNVAVNTLTGNEIIANSVDGNRITAFTLNADRLNMGMGDTLFNAADGLFLLNSHGEINEIKWWTQRRQKATISGAFHQEAGRWPGTRALVIDNAVTNHITEQPTKGTWSTDGAFVTDANSTEQFLGFSSHHEQSRKLHNTSGRDAYKYFVFTAGGAGTNISVYGYQTTGTAVELSLQENFGSYTVIATINSTQTGCWERLSVYGATTVGNSYRLRVKVPHNSIVYIDAAQATNWTLTSFCCGCLAWCSWSGATEASTSTRVATEVNLDAYTSLISENNTLTFATWVQMPYDADGTWPTYCRIFDTRGADNDNRVMLAYIAAIDVFGVFHNGGWQTHDTAQTFKAGDWIHLAYTQDYTNDSYKLYVNTVMTEYTTAFTAPTLTEWNVGSEYNALQQSGFAFDEFAVLDRVFTANEIAAMYASGRPFKDAGAMEAAGIYILDGKFKMASSTSGARMELDESGLIFKNAAGNSLIELDASDASFSLKSATSGQRIEISPTEIAGYNSAGTKQFYLQASDGKAMFGGGKGWLGSSGMSLVEGTDNFNKVKWVTSGGSQIGYIAADWGGGAGDKTVTWVQANDTVSGDGSEVILIARDGAADVRLRVISSGSVRTNSGVTDYRLVNAHLRVMKGIQVGSMLEPDEDCVNFGSTTYRLRRNGIHIEWYNGSAWVQLD